MTYCLIRAYCFFLILRENYWKTTGQKSDVIILIYIKNSNSTSQQDVSIDFKNDNEKVIGLLLLSCLMLICAVYYFFVQFCFFKSLNRTKEGKVK